MELGPTQIPFCTKHYKNKGQIAVSGARNPPKRIFAENVRNLTFSYFPLENDFLDKTQESSEFQYFHDSGTPKQSIHRYSYSRSGTGGQGNTKFAKKITWNS